MKNCTNCKHANWAKTAAGKMHPSGDGKCTYPYKVPELPEAFYWIGQKPSPGGGMINRRRDLDDHCSYFKRHDA